MSMFYNLMMRAKEVYAQMFGTLTESPSGVFSGFSNDNYFLINSRLPEDVTEVQFEFTQPSTVASSGTQSLFNAGIFAITMYQKKINFYGGRGTPIIIPAEEATPNSTYRIKLTISGKVFTHCYSKDGGDFTTPQTWTSNQAYNDDIRIGNSTTSGRGWKGKFNMNNTHIKRGNSFWFKGKVKY